MFDKDKLESQQVYDDDLKEIVKGLQRIEDKIDDIYEKMRDDKCDQK